MDSSTKINRSLSDLTNLNDTSTNYLSNTTFTKGDNSTIFQGDNSTILESDDRAHSPGRVALAAGVLLLYAAAMAVNLGVVSYERGAPDTHRTLVNKLVSLSSAYNAVVATGVLPPLALLESLFPTGLWGSVCRSAQFLIVAGFEQVRQEAKNTMRL